MNSPGNFWHMPANRPLHPNVLDLNDTVEGMLKMLRRLIGEDIDLAWLLEAGLWLVKWTPPKSTRYWPICAFMPGTLISGVGKITIETHNDL
jgi:two-component system, cell cycle sensor histidine kinase and response regulator CckA